MIAITRDDGVKFVMAPYRKLIKTHKKSAIITEIKRLAVAYGHFICLPTDNNGTNEVAFSEHSGYLLGESIKQYFYQTRHLIFCERVSTNDQVVVVVVRDGCIELDTLIPPHLLCHQLKLLINDNTRYHIYTSGSVPLKHDLTETAAHEFVLPQHNIACFETLNESLLPRLPALETLKLVPLKEALTHAGLKRQFINMHSVVILISSLAVINLLLFMYQNTLKNTIREFNASNFNTDRPYYTALTTAKPVEVLNELEQFIKRLKTLSGWQATDIKFKSGKFSADMTSSGGTLQKLHDWSERYQYQFYFRDNMNSIVFSCNLGHRPLPHSIYSIEQITKLLISRLNPLLTMNQISFNTTIKHQDSTQLIVTLHLKHCSLSQLILIGQQLAGLPIAIDQLSFQLAGTITGDIQLSIWGI